jgi:FdhE protein
MGYEEFLFIVINWLKPLFVALRERSHESNPEEYRGRTCPFCGYYPDSGLYSTDRRGKRYLRCGLCENLWLYRRISCAVCGESDAKKLDYLVLEDNERYRIDSCLTCMGYIKSVKLNKFEDIEGCDMTVENLLTMSLDAEMIRKGYNRP